MADDRTVAELERFLADRADGLMHAAVLLTGSRDAGQDLLQRKLLLLRPVTQPMADPTAEVDLRDALVRLLLRLPPRQRAVLVLRYWEQLTEAETAELLGWPEGTVKSATARGRSSTRCSPAAPRR
jgi:sigma-70-like protein